MFGYILIAVAGVLAIGFEVLRGRARRTQARHRDHLIFKRYREAARKARRQEFPKQNASREA